MDLIRDLGPLIVIINQENAQKACLQASQVEVSLKEGYFVTGDSSCVKLMNTN